MTMPFFSATICEPKAGVKFRNIVSDYSFWAFSNKSPLRLLQPYAAGRTSEIKVSTLALTAEHDTPACLEIADHLQETIPGCKRITMPETGHLMQLERPNEFNQIIEEFLRSVGP